jgi:hypothetical protein
MANGNNPIPWPSYFVWLHVRQEGRMNMSLATLIKATAFGIAPMYMYDPVLGRRRRALLRDKCVRIRKAVTGTRPSYAT